MTSAGRRASILCATLLTVLLAACTGNLDYRSPVSIIGDRGKGDTPDSTDGVVPSSSSQLPGAQSELIVPSRHSVHIHPAAIAEIRRILHLHLRS